MSTTIDRKVVEMRFDNKQFESGVSTTMSSVDKLKKKLNFSGASDGLKELNAAVKSIDFSHVGRGIESVKVQFSALQVMGVRAFTRIADAAINAGKRMASEFTVEPFKQGYEEYELKLDSIQTIMASTGENLETVNKYLNELNTYADKTIYSFSDMTSNIGKFTNAGVKLEDAVKAIQGISNEAAVSGANANEASRAMYNFAQALSAGAVKLIDWKSIENANMATVEFKNELIKTALEVGTLVQQEGSYISTTTDLNGDVSDAFTTTRLFNESLSSQWMTTEVLVKTLGRYADETTEIGKKSFAAAQDVKTFSQLLDTLKEAVGSGWSMTWELIFGDFNQAKKVWTGVSNTLGAIIDKMSDARNALIKGALDRNPKQDEFLKRLNDAGISTELFEERVKITARNLGIDIDTIIQEQGSLANAFMNRKLSFSLITLALNDFVKAAENGGVALEQVSDKVNYYNDITARTIRGEFGNGASRLEALTQAGYDAALVQGLVNKIWERNGHTWDDCSMSAEELAASIQDLSDGELAAWGYTQDQIAAFRSLADEADKAGTPLHELVIDLYKPTGRELIIDTVRNSFEALTKAMKVVSSAWRDVFPAMTSLKLYDIIDDIHNFSENLIMSDDTAEKLIRTLRGLFSALDIVRSVVTGGLKLGLKLLNKVLNAFGMDVLDLTANIGDAIYGFREFVKSNDLVNKVVDVMAAGIVRAVKAIVELYTYLSNLPQVQAVIENIEKIFDNLKNVDLMDVGGYIIDGLRRGLEEGITSIPKILLDIGKKIISTICEVLDIQSPSKVMIAIGGFVIAGLILGFQNGLPELQNLVRNIANGIASFFGVEINWDDLEKKASGLLDFFKSLYDSSALDHLFGEGSIVDQVKNTFGGIQDAICGFDWSSITNTISSGVKHIQDFMAGINWPQVFAIASLGGIIFTIKKIYDLINRVVGIGSDISGGIKNLMSAAKDFVDGLSKISDAVSSDIKARSMKQLAIAIAILVGAVVALAFVPVEDLKKAVGTVIILAGVLVGLSFATEKMSKASADIGKDGISLEGLKTGLLQIGAALLMLAIAIKIMGKLNPDEAKQGFFALAGMAAGMLVFIGLLGKIAKKSGDISQFDKSMVFMAAAMLLMTVVLKRIAKMEPEDVVVGIMAMEAFILLLAQMGLAQRAAGKGEKKFGSTMLAMAASMAIMAGVIKLISTIDPEDIVIGLAVMEGFTLLLIQMGLAQRAGGKGETKFGSSILAMAASMAIMVGVIKLINTVSTEDLARGLIVVELFVLLIRQMVKSLKGTNETKNVGRTLLAMSVAIAIMAAVAVALGYVPIENLAKGVVAVGILGAIVALMVRQLKGVNEAKGSIVAMALVITILAGALAALSLIPTDSLAAAAGSLSLVMAAFAIVLRSTGKMGDAKKAFTPMLAMGLLVAEVAVILGALTSMNIQPSIETAASLSTLLLALSAAFWIVSKSGEVDKSTVGSMALMGLVLGEIGLIIGVLRGIGLDISMSIENALSLSTLFIALSAATLIISKAGPMAASGALHGVEAMAILITGVGLILAALGGLTYLIPDAAEMLHSGIPILTEIGLAIGSFVGSIISGIGEGLVSGLPEIAEKVKAFMETMGEIGKIEVDSSGFEGVGKMVKAMIAIDIAGLFDKFTSSILGESAIGSFTKNAIAFTAAMSAVSAIASVCPINSEAVGKVADAGELFVQLVNSLPKQDGLWQKVTGQADFSGFTDTTKAFITAMLEVNKEVSQDDFSFNKTVFDNIADVGEAFADLNKALPRTDGWIQTVVGQADIEKFGTKVKAFIDTMIKVNKTVGDDFVFNKSVFTAVAEAGESFAVLNNKLPRTDGWVQDIVGAKDLTTFGKQVKNFISSMVSMQETLGDTTIDLEVVQNVIDAASKLSDFQGNLENTGGVIDFFIGQNDLGTFGDHVSKFAVAIGKLIQNVGADGISESQIKSVASLGTMLKDLQENLPEEHLFDGKVNLEDFAGYITNFANALRSYNSSVENLNNDNISFSISQVGKLVRMIAILNDVDTTNAYSLVGYNDGGFFSCLSYALTHYNEDVSELSWDNISTSVAAVTSLADMTVKLAGTNLTGADKFKPEAIGTALKAYAEQTKDIDSANVENSVDAARKLRVFIASLTTLDSGGIENFVVDGLGESIKKYSNAVSGVDVSAVTDSVTAGMAVVGFISSLSGLDTDGPKSFKMVVEQLGSTSIEKIIKSFGTSTGSIEDAAGKLALAISDGIEGKRDTIEQTAETLIESVSDKITDEADTFGQAGSSLIDGLDNGFNVRLDAVIGVISLIMATSVQTLKKYWGEFYTSGQFLGQGLALGIDAKKGSVYAAAFALGQMAVRGERDGQKSHSPSKAMIQSGEWLGEGLIIGINRMTSDVYSAGQGMGDSVTKSISSAIAAFSQTIDSGMDTTPTIRPVLDLSEIQAGADQIDGMFGSFVPMSVLANVRSTTAMMNNRGQSGGSGDVVGAINKLRGDLGKVGNISYTINGITYDDGSNVSDAVQQLIRAARVERRV